MLYLDWAATTPPDITILEAAAERSACSYGNPSSTHREGRAAKALLEDARNDFLESIGFNSQAVSPGRAERTGGRDTVSSLRPGLVFTGSGTEADQLPFFAILRKHLEQQERLASPRRPHLVVSSIEHAAIHGQATLLSRIGFDTSFVKPRPDGIVDPAAIGGAMRPETRLVAVMAVNNETGAVQDLPAIGASIRAAWESIHPGLAGRALPPAPWFHADCVQALGKIPLDLPAIASGTSSAAHAPPFSAAFSAHKLRGPRGVGALLHTTDFEPLAAGGGQERGLRSGTENLSGILAFAAAAKKAADSLEAGLVHARSLESMLIEGLSNIPGVRVLPGSRVAGDFRYSPWILSAAFPGLAGEVFARALSDEGIAVSTGSACSHNDSRKKGRRILDAMGTPEELSFSAIRISTGTLTTAADIGRFLETAADLYRRLKS
jgi:cysteine desulfurase